MNQNEEPLFEVKLCIEPVFPFVMVYSYRNEIETWNHSNIISPLQLCSTGLISMLPKPLAHNFETSNLFQIA